MNYLAHIFLSQNNISHCVGNFIADSIQGNNFTHYGNEIQQGIQLHRFIDTFTDAHPVFRKSKTLFKPQFNHYSGVVADVVYDYYLAKNWNLFTTESLRSYASRVYDELFPFVENMPLPAQRFYAYMVKHDILYHYQYLDSIAYVLQGITNRAKSKIDLSQAIHVIENNDQELQEQFLHFWQEICTEVKTFTLTSLTKV